MEAEVDRAGRSLYRVIGKAQLMTAAPFAVDVVDDQRPPHTFDRPFLEAMPAIVGGNEQERMIGLKRNARRRAASAGIEVGAPVPGLRAARQIDLHGEPLGADVGVRLEPEPASVLGVFDAQIGAAEIDSAQRLERADRARILKARREQPELGEGLLMRGIQERARCVVLVAAPRPVAHRGRLDHQALKRARQSARPQLGQQLVSKRPRPRLRRRKRGQERRHRPFGVDCSAVRIG